MSKKTEISWCDSTFNPWIGCTKVSAGCANCFAATQDNHRKWTPDGWGKGKPRKRTSEAYWREPLKWNREAGVLGVRKRVFCASLADVFDAEVAHQWRADLFRLIQETPHLDWLLLTKRPENIMPSIVAAYIEAASLSYHADNMMFDWSEGRPPENVWLGVSVEDERVLWRARELSRIPAAVRFVSAEPLLGPLDFGFTNGLVHGEDAADYKMDWIITGCESGHNRRPFEVDWVRSIYQQCRAADVAFFNKQMIINGKVSHSIEEFPEDLQAREFPRPAVLLEPTP